MPIFRIICFSILLASGCNQQLEEKDLIGNFEHGINPNRYERIEFSEDGNFVYDFRNDYLNGRTIGKWEIKENSLLLNSYIEPPEMNDPDYLTYFDHSDNGFRIKALDHIYEFGLPYVHFIVYGKEKQVRCLTDDQGECLIKDIVPEKILLSDPTYGSFLIDVQGKDVSGLQLILDPSREYYRYFINEKWTASKNQLIPPPMVYGENDSLAYEKVEYFQWEIH